MAFSIFGLVLLGLGALAEVIACSCVILPNEDRATQFQSYKVISAGKVVKVTPPPKGYNSEGYQIWNSVDRVTYDFAVERVLKGAVGSLAQVTSAVSSATCRLEFDLDSIYLVFPYLDSLRALSAGLCSPHRKLGENRTYLDTVATLLEVSPVLRKQKRYPISKPPSPFNWETRENRYLSGLSSRREYMPSNQALEA